MTSIPRVFHHIWIGGPMPPRFERFRESWQRHNPGWEMRLWTEKDLDWLENQEFFDNAAEWTPERYIRRFQANLARYEIIWRYGGVYVDADIEALNPLEPWLDGITAFSAKEHPNWVNNGLIGGVPGHPFWRLVIDSCPDRIREFKGQRSPISCGPHLITKLVNENPGMLSLLPQEKVYPYHWSEVQGDWHPEPPADAICHHIWNVNSLAVSIIVPWRDDGSKERRRAWEWLERRFRERYPEWQVVAASDGLEGPFSRARAVQNAIPQTYGDVVVVHDADCWAHNLEDAVEAVRAGYAWANPSAKVYRLTASETERVLDGEEPSPDMKTWEKPYSNVPAGGVVVLSRETLLAVPPDARFVGWGGEDAAWTTALDTLVGPPWEGGGICYALYHKPQPRMNRVIGTKENEDLVNRYRLLRYRPRHMQLLVDQGRIQ
jgi:hypothetical protein